MAPFAVVTEYPLRFRKRRERSFVVEARSLQLAQSKRDTAHTESVSRGFECGPCAAIQVTGYFALSVVASQRRHSEQSVALSGEVTCRLVDLQRCLIQHPRPIHAPCVGGLFGVGQNLWRARAGSDGGRFDLGRRCSVGRRLPFVLGARGKGDGRQQGGPASQHDLVGLRAQLLHAGNCLLLKCPGAALAVGVIGA